MIKLVIGVFALAAPLFVQDPALTERPACVKKQEWSVRVRARGTVRTGLDVPLEVALGGGAAGGTFRVTLRAPAGALTLAQTSWDETLAPGQTVRRTVNATCTTEAPVPLVAQMRRLDAGFEHAVPAQHAVRLLPLAPGLTTPSSTGWDPASGRAVGTPGEEHLTLRSGEKILVVPAR